MTASLENRLDVSPEPVTSDDVAVQVLATARRAKVASRVLATATRSTKDAALHALADALVASTAEIVAANAEDLA